jgi:imidazolonepropionase
MSRLLLTGIGRLWTGHQVVERAAVLVDGDRIAWAGPAADLPSGRADAVEDLDGALVTPGLIDAHTHPVYAGDRFAELSLRSAGAGYAEIAAAGGGIASTVQATRAAHPDRLTALVTGRLAAWLAQGATTVEAKTGYLLTREGELDAVRLLAALPEPLHAPGPGVPLPRLAVTFLAAHAVPPEWAGDRAGYAAEAASWAPAAAATGATGVDVFCDEGYFTVDEARAVLTAGRAAGLAPRLHADELARTGGAQLAAELGCLSADHLLAATAEDAAALAAAGVAAVLCPGTALAMRRTPPARELAAAGVTLALGSDHNPGQVGTTSMPLVVALAVAALGLSVDQALRAATAGGAAALGRDDVGVLAPGRLADLVAWDADHEGAFAWAFGLRPLRVWLGGRAVPVNPPAA